MNWFAIISAVLWGVSSGAWLWAATVKPPIVKDPHGYENALIVRDGPNGGLSLGGMLNPSFKKFDAYFSASAKRNAFAAVISAAASFFALLAIVYQ
ncbi:hypothetical protein [Brucella sp. NBRC 12950]|uniref:hypothetical protein n=1 Tax=Brucella sp. NBRC 12950 TaxID=2994518 RepID=UPI0024A44194|nr:hypothetical protein [Brucella sp. NBRC 12950]GLU25535.1 hypothetical protein Brsp01_07680 [Brucella sp. NBRC 12950]